MTRIGPRDLKPASDVEAIEDAFRSLEKSIELGSVDDYIELRREMMVRFDEHYRISSRSFDIGGVLSGFADNIWHFTQKVVEREGSYSPESICKAFEAFCMSGELVLDTSPQTAEVNVGMRDLLSMAGGARIKYHIINAEPIGKNLSIAAEVLLEDGSEIASFAARLEGALSRVRAGNGEAVADVSELIFGDELVTHMGSLSDAFEDYYFGPFINGMGAIATEARRAFEEGGADDAAEKVEALGRNYAVIKEVFDSMGDVLRTVVSTTKNLKKEVEDEKVHELMDRHKPFLHHFASVGHDYNNFLTAINGYLQNLRVKDDKLRVIKALEEVCLRTACSTLADLLAVIRMKMNVVRISAEHIDGVSIPDRYRRPLFRSLFELVKNAEKYRDRDKEVSHTIDLVASKADGLLRFTVEDNGVGIEDVARVLGEGVRERPDLADGSGLGLAGIVRMSQENGWRFSLESELGIGTKATLEIDTSDWNRSPGGGLGSGAGDGQVLGASAAQATSTMNATLGAGILMGIMPCLA